MYVFSKLYERRVIQIKIYDKDYHSINFEIHLQFKVTSLVLCFHLSLHITYYVL